VDSNARVIGCDNVYVGDAQPRHRAYVDGFERMTTRRCFRARSRC
jgi:hypothetical protein